MNEGWGIKGRRMRRHIGKASKFSRNWGMIKLKELHNVKDENDFRSGGKAEREFLIWGDKTPRRMGGLRKNNGSEEGSRIKRFQKSKMQDFPSWQICTDILERINTCNHTVSWPLFCQMTVMMSSGLICMCRLITVIAGAEMSEYLIQFILTVGWYR